MPTKDFSILCYFIGIEVAESKDDILISQREYAMDNLEELGLMNPMDPNAKVLPSHGESFSDPEKCTRLVVKLSYFTITGSNISFVVRVACQFLYLNPPFEGCNNSHSKLYLGSCSPLYEVNGYTLIVGYFDANWASSATGD